MGTFFNSNYFASTSHTDAFGLRTQIKSHAPPFIFSLLIWAMINDGDGVADDEGDEDSDNSDVDRFTKTFFWNFQSIPADLCYILIYKQMLEKVFCSNIAPSLSSGNHLFYKAEYMGRSCPNQVWAITFDWSALAT